jgi:hypothetical protein
VHHLAMVNKLTVPSKVLTVVLLEFLNMQLAIDDDLIMGHLWGVQ